MHPIIRPLKAIFRQFFIRKPNLKLEILSSVQNNPPPKHHNFSSSLVSPNTSFHSSSSSSSLPAENKQDHPDGELAFQIQSTLKIHRRSPKRKTELALSYCCPPSSMLTQDLVLDVLRRHSSDWKPAYVFFNWVSKEGLNVRVGSPLYNEILDILGKMRRFDELSQVLDEMSKREGLFDEETYGVLLNRYAAAHKVEEAILLFNKRRMFGIESDLAAFQKLLMWLCRYKHVEVAETLLHDSVGGEFDVDVKTMNIVLNGWCVMGNVREAKRFWKEILGSSKYKPDMFTYGTFIKALTKKGKLGTAMKLYRSMWEEGCQPNAVICNCVIDALCFKKRVPEALEVFREMKERGCFPNVATYNSLIKHLCRIQRMEKVYELVDEMETKKGTCAPNGITFNYLLKSLKKPEEVIGVLQRMERNGCSIECDTYNLILKLYIDWDCEEKAKYTWDEMEKNGLGPDQRSYTIMIHGLHDKGRFKDALLYHCEMTSKGMTPEPRTEILIDDMKTKLKANERDQGRTSATDNNKWSRSMRKRRRKINIEL